MVLIVRDEDPPTVAAAINAYAIEEGLEPIDLDEAMTQDPMSLLGVLVGPRVMVSASGGEHQHQVVVVGLESLDIAETEEWGTNISTACETEVIAAEAFDDSVRFYVFDSGEIDAQFDVPVDASASKPARAPQLVELADTDEGKRELEAGIVGSNGPDVLQEILRCLGATSPDKDSVVMLAFHDPLDEQEEEVVEEEKS